MEKLKMIRFAISLMQSGHPFSIEEADKLYACIQSAADAFPPTDEQQLEMLHALSRASTSDVPWRDEWDAVIDAMTEIVNGAEHTLARPTTLTNRSWIMGFMALHNLPRVFFLPDQTGLWNEPLSPITAEFALASASVFRVSGTHRHDHPKWFERSICFNQGASKQK